MDFGTIWNELIVGPLTQGLLFLAGASGSAGLAIILLTLIIRGVMLPLSIYQMRSQKAMAQMQPELAALRRKYGKDRERMTQETMRLYKEHGINPAAGCLPLLVQMPIFIGLYSVLYGQAQHFEEPFLWLSSLAHPDPFYILPVLTMASQFVLQRMMTVPTDDPQQQMMNRTMMFMPLVFGFITFSLPSGVVLYWVASNVFSLVQQYFTTGWGSLFPSATSTTNQGQSSPVTVTEERADGEARPARARARTGGKPRGRKGSGKR